MKKKELKERKLKINILEKNHPLFGVLPTTQNFRVNINNNKKISKKNNKNANNNLERRNKYNSFLAMPHF